jgi:hypothetical protein
MSTTLTVYRGQKNWNDKMDVCAPTLRRSLGGQDPAVWTDTLLAMIDGLIQGTEQGNTDSRHQLESQLLYSQQSAFQNPFVSCSHQWAIAQSFATFGDTPGYVLTITGDPGAGVDVQDLRTRHQLYGDAMDYLYEFGIPRRLMDPFIISQVDLVAPFGQPSARVYP